MFVNENYAALGALASAHCARNVTKRSMRSRTAKCESALSFDSPGTLTFAIAGESPSQP